MFINKSSSSVARDPLASPSSVQTGTIMNSHIDAFFNHEITCIPTAIRSVVGDYYNNGFCNASTWTVALWCFIRYFFEKSLNGIFRMQRYKEYVRIRLIRSIWYWGFYGACLIYCGTTLAHTAPSEMELFNFKKMSVPSAQVLPLQTTIGYTLISTFYWHCFLWECISSNSRICMWKYFFLALTCALSYTLRVTEICFMLTALIGISQVVCEHCRIFYVLLNRQSLLSNIMLWGSFIIAFTVFIAVHVIVIPLTFIVPLSIKVLSDYPDILLIFLLLSLVVWLFLELYNSLLFQLFEHKFYHDCKINIYGCNGDVLECALFPPRNDDLYNITVLRKEIEEREKERLSKRKPKNRTSLIQTLKCMVAIKKKLTHRRLRDSSESEDSEKSEHSPNKNDDSEENSDSERESGSDSEMENEEEVNTIMPESKELQTEKKDYINFDSNEMTYSQCNQPSSDPELVTKTEAHDFSALPDSSFMIRMMPSSTNLSVPSSAVQVPVTPDISEPSPKSCDNLTKSCSSVDAETPVSLESQGSPIEKNSEPSTKSSGVIENATSQIQAGVPSSKSGFFEDTTSSHTSPSSPSPAEPCSYLEDVTLNKKYCNLIEDATHKSHYSPKAVSSDETFDTKEISKSSLKYPFSGDVTSVSCTCKYSSERSPSEEPFDKKRSEDSLKSCSPIEDITPVSRENQETTKSNPLNKAFDLNKSAPGVKSCSVLEDIIPIGREYQSSLTSCHSKNAPNTKDCKSSTESSPSDETLDS